MHTRAALIITIAVVLCAPACSKDSPTPTAPTPERWNLTGTVQRADTGTLVADAALDILDGPNAGRTATTNTVGSYAFDGLLAGGFTVRVRHADYQEMAQGVTLTAHRTLDFRVTKILRADLVREGVITHYPQAPNYTSWDFAGHGVNRGDGCASAISGTLQLLTALGHPVPGASRTFSLPAGTIIRPLERFDYRGCCHSTGELDLTTSHTTVFTWTDVACP